MALPESSTLILGRYLTKHCSLSSAGIPCSSFSLLSLGQCLTELFRTFSSSPPRSSQEPPQTRAPSRIPPRDFSRFQKASAAQNNQNVAGTSNVLEPPSLFRVCLSFVAMVSPAAECKAIHHKRSITEESCRFCALSICLTLPVSSALEKGCHDFAC